MNKVLCFLIYIFFFFEAISQPPKTYSSSEIFQHIKKLNVLGSVLYVAAHPDDENTRLLSYLANDKLYRTGYLSLTRGDGGQNLIGDEQGVELGLIRTQELLAARKIDGAEQFFSRAYDFGFSKNPEETFKFWNRQKILSDVVWIIRKFRPDVIITRFPSTGEGGHGHHTASAILAEEAFETAADPDKFPDQLKYGVAPWRAKRLLWNSFNFSNDNTQREGQYRIDVGGYNTLLGKSYGEVAAESRSQHKSQGFGVPRSRGTQYEYFKTIKGDPPANHLLDGIVTGWGKLNDKNIQLSIDELAKNYSFQQPENSISGLIKLYNNVQQITDEYWKKQKSKEIIKLIEACSGLYMEATTSQQYAIQGDSLKVLLTINNRSGINSKNAYVNIRNTPYKFNDELNKNINVSRTAAFLIPEKESLSQPYWLAESPEKGSFNVSDQELIGAPVTEALMAEFNVEVDGIPLKFYKPLQYKSNDPVKGEQYEPLPVIPKLEVNYTGNTFISINNKPVNILRHIKSNTNDSMRYQVNETFSENVKADKNSFVYRNSEKNRDDYSSTIVQLNKKKSGQKENIIMWATDGTDTFCRYKKAIQYDHIPSIVYFPLAEANIIPVELKIAGKKIGYVPGAGDKVPEALQQMGYEVTILSEKDLTENNLMQFDAIITGIRAYNVHDWLSNAYEVIMNYIKQGGVLVVQYNTNSNVGPLRAKVAPFAFNVSRTRVTDEEAKVNFLLPSHQVLNFPNKITEKDFEGWVQERSTYHADGFESNYQAILSMKDPGDAEQNGSLIVTGYGKGKFIYTGLAFFRELPAGVPGAYRLMANLLAPSTIK